MSRHVLVTGGCGFIGSNFIRFVRQHRPQWQVTNLDCLSYSGNAENLAELDGDTQYRFVRGNVCDATAVRNASEECDCIVHFAAESHVDRSIMDSKPFVMTNVLGTQAILDAVWSRDGSGDTMRLVYVSTDEVYGSLPLDDPSRKFHEGMNLAPNSPYAASKAAGDLLCLAHHRTFGTDVVVTRCSNNFGPFQFPEKVIPLFVTNLMEGDQVPLYGDGLNVRDWIHVDDHCEALLQVLERGTSGEVYNIGGNNERSNLDLTHSILDVMGKDQSSICFVADRLGHDRRYAIDGTKIERELGWRPSRSDWPAALQATVKWYMDNEKWWRRVKSGAYRSYYEQQYGEARGR